MSNFWAILRIFEYLLVIILCAGLLRLNPTRLVYISNVILASFLMLNAINYVIGVPNSPAFQISFTFIVSIWVVMHLIELLRK